MKTYKILLLTIFTLILVQSVCSLDNNLYVASKYNKQEICPCTSSVFEFEIKNIGLHPEIYTLDVDKEFRQWTTFSNNNILLDPGKKIKVYANMMPDCNFYGHSKLDFFIRTTTTKLKAKIPVELNINSCYIPDIEPKELTIGYDKTSTDLNIINTGSKTASYLLVLDKPDWAEIKPNTITIGPGKIKTVTLKTEPSENIRKGIYHTSLITVVSENNAQYEHIISIKLTSPSIFSKLYGFFKANIAKFLLYSLLIFLPFLIILILILLSRKIKSRPKKEKSKVKKIEEKKVIEKKIKLKKKTKARTIIIPEKNKKKLIFGIIAIFLILIVEINLFAFKDKLTFETKKNITIPEVIPQVAQINAIYQGTITDIGLTIWDFISTYYLYLIISAVLLAVIIVLLILIIKKKIKISRVKEGKVVIKKEKKPKSDKKLKIKISRKTIIPIIIAVLIIGLIFAGISLWKIIKPYLLYMVIGFVLLAIIIFIITRKKRKTKFKPKKIEEKKVIEKKIIEKLKKKKIKKPKRKTSTKTIKTFLKIFVVIVVLLLIALFITMNYEKIKTQKEKAENFVVDTFSKTKQAMNSLLKINFTRLIKSEEIEIEPGIPPQKWAVNTIHNLDLSKYFSDPDNDPLTYSSTLPENIAVEINENIATFSPEYNWTGINKIIFTADDGKGGVMESNEVYLIVEEEKPGDATDKLINLKTKIINFFVDIKDYIVFYLNYIIAGFVILVILILIITYNKKLLKLIEGEKPKRKKNSK